VFGGRFDTGVTPLRILLIGQIVNVAVGSVGFILIMVGRTGWDLTVYAGSFVVDLGVAFWLAPGMGARGAAVAQAVTLVVANAARLYLVWRFVHIQPFNRYYARLAVPAGVAGLAMVGAHALLANGAWPVDLVVTGVAGAVVYGAVLIGAGLTPTERAAIGRVVAGRRGG
jgi:O-antigen/teichoic acid export membrane protein